MSRLVRLSCGKHWGAGPEGRACQKCRYFNTKEYQRRERKGTQYSGTPWVAILHKENT